MKDETPLITSASIAIKLIHENRIILSISLFVSLLFSPLYATSMVFRTDIFQLGPFLLYLAALIISLAFVLSGANNLIHRAYSGESTGYRNFKKGGKKFFFPILIGEIVLIFALLVFVNISIYSPVIILLLFQFFDLGVVLDDDRNTAGFKKSVSLFINAKKLVLIFSTILLILTGLQALLYWKILFPLIRFLLPALFSKTPGILSILIVFGIIFVEMFFIAFVLSFRTIFYIKTSKQ